MHRGRGHISRALAVLPLTLALLLVLLALPSTCFASSPEPSSASSVPACRDTTSLAFAPAHIAVQTQTSVPASHQHGDPRQCDHSPTSTQALTVDQVGRAVNAVAVPAVAAAVVPAPVPLTTVVNERPSRPPGLVLTVSQLRI